MARFDQYRYRLRRFAVKALCLLMVAATVWGGAWVSSASAVGSEKAAEILKERAAAELDRMSSKTSAFDADLDIDSAGRELKGKVKRDVRRTKSKAAELGDDLEDAADSVVDSVKDLLN